MKSLWVTSRFRFAAFLIFLAFSLFASVLLSSIGKVSESVSSEAEGPRITPAGSLLIDAQTRLPAVGALTMDFVRSPDHTGTDGLGRYLLAVNSGFGIQFSATTNRGQQSLAVIDLNAQPAPAVVQNVYFPEPQSINVGLCFARQADADGTFALYASGGFENKIWVFRFRVGADNPITPFSPGPNTTVKAPFIDVSKFASETPSPRYNNNHAPVYPTGMSITWDGNTLFVANNLDDSLGIIHDLRGARRVERISLRGIGNERSKSAREKHFVYPYGVIAIPFPPINGSGHDAKTESTGAKGVYVSCWNDDSVAVVDLVDPRHRVSYIPVGHHPTAMIWDGTRSRLYVVNSNSDSVSMIDTRYNREVERIDIRLSEKTRLGGTPEGLALNADGTTLYVANAHSNSVAVISLSSLSLDNSGTYDRPAYLNRTSKDRSRVRGFIPTGLYPSALAVVNKTLFVANGKGTGFESSSLTANLSQRAPNTPNDRFPVGTGRGVERGGEYIVALISGDISMVAEPDERMLARYTQQVMRNNGMLDQPRAKLFRGASPIKHIIYIIKENRSYDQVFGDIERAGNGEPADGDKNLAIFGAGEATRMGGGAIQNVTPNQHALALRFGLFDRFFVNAEASPDGHNWSTAAISTDYVDKAYRWNYSRRGRTYDFEGFNRMHSYEATRGAAPLFSKPAAAHDIDKYLRQYIPYLNGSRDVAEPDTLYLWDAMARAGLSYRNYGEFISTISEADVAAVNANKHKSYPDVSRTVSSTATKKSLENHFCPTYPNFDLHIPDAITTESYRAAKESGGVDPLISRSNADEKFRGSSRFSEWLTEFESYVADIKAGRPDRLPSFSMVRLPNNHTDALTAGMPSPQFYVADNDYAVGRLVEAVSNSTYWRNTAIFILEDDAQDGPDHVDAHRSPALVISAYNRPGALIHTFHNTVSLIRTMEMLLGIEPMNALDAVATPMDMFRDEADLRPYTAVLPDVALNNLTTPPGRDEMTRYWMKRSAEQDLTHADMADPSVVNQAIWFAVKGNSLPAPKVTRLPIYDSMRADTDKGAKQDNRDDP
jgi:DNA-binding beta-propeller fold protein YncE